MLSRAWYLHLPGDVYALGPFRFERPTTEQEARAYMRDWLKVQRLPIGAQVWKA